MFLSSWATYDRSLGTGISSGLLVLPMVVQSFLSLNALRYQSDPWNLIWFFEYSGLRQLVVTSSVWCQARQSRCWSSHHFQPKLSSFANYVYLPSSFRVPNLLDDFLSQWKSWQGGWSRQELPREKRGRDEAARPKYKDMTSFLLF